MTDRDELKRLGYGDQFKTWQEVALAEEARSIGLSLELERVQKQAAAMRQAIEDFTHNVKHQHVAGWGDISSNVQVDASFRELKTALQLDAGSDYIHCDQVKPLVEALKPFAACDPSGMGSTPRDKVWLWKPSQTSRELPGVSVAMIDAAKAALSHAKTLGL